MFWATPSAAGALAEFSLEARIRLPVFGGNFGVVPFVDAGNVYTGSLPDFSGMRVGVGAGLRYYSSFGPIRIDVGTPLGRRSGETVDRGASLAGASVLKALRWLGGIALAIALLLGLVAVGIDTDAGHRFAVRRIAALKPSSGLRITIGRIDGSLWNRATIREPAPCR